MNLRTQIYLAAIAIVVIACVTSWLWSNHKIAVLEHELGDAKAAAIEKQQLADEKEKQAGEFKAKIDYLEQQADELRAARQKQDEELKKLSANVGDARRDVSRTRVTRTKPATADELCAKLANLGHPCE
jgi:peptidoglycan hydrolase CwlO-like protein